MDKKEEKRIRAAIDEFYTLTMARQARSRDKKEIQAYIDSRGITTRVIGDRVTILDKKQRVIAQKSLKDFE